VTLNGGGSTIYTSGTLSVRVAVPGTNTGVPKQTVKITLTGAVSDTSNSTVEWVTTDTSGNATVDFSVPSQLPGSVSVSATMSLAVSGMLFYDPTMFASDAQILASARTPVAANDSLSLTALGPPTGTLQVLKSVDDAAYWAAWPFSWASWPGLGVDDVARRCEVDERPCRSRPPSPRSQLHSIRCELRLMHSS